MLWDKKGFIIRSLLEVDAYKLTMLAFIWRFYPRLRVRFGFHNRHHTRVPLGRVISLSKLREELEYVKGLTFTADEIVYLRSWGIFPDAFLQFLPTLRLADIAVRKGEDDALVIETEGLWLHTTLWETIVLAIVSELYARYALASNAMHEEYVYHELFGNANAKIEQLKQSPPMQILQFGLRRRFSRKWERAVTKLFLDNDMPFAGISNVALARELCVEAKGTNAHELPMALTALAHRSDEAMRQAQYDVLRKWKRMYGRKLLIALPDTFGSAQFLERMPQNLAESYKGFRQDSGDPKQFADRLLAFYQKRGIDPRDKMIIFSDGLTVPVMRELYNQYHDRFGTVAFGWGTNLTNDGPITPLSLVMKLQEAAGNPAVKLSDNIAKATGPAEAIEEYKRVFGYADRFVEEPVY